MNLPDYCVHDDKYIKGFHGQFEFLSNFWVAPVFFEGLMYNSSEAAYQAAKCALEQDRVHFQNLTPSAAKKRGKVVPLRDDWDEVKFDVMATIVFDKFYRNTALRLQLIETGRCYLEETNSWNDRIWGVHKGIGNNWLGQILMRVRDFWQTHAYVVSQPKLSRLVIDDFY